MSHWHDNSLERMLHNLLQEFQSWQSELKLCANLGHRSAELEGLQTKILLLGSRYQKVEGQPLTNVHRFLAQSAWQEKFLKGHLLSLRGEQVYSHPHVTKGVGYGTLTEFMSYTISPEFVSLYRINRRTKNMLALSFKQCQLLYCS